MRIYKQSLKCMLTVKVYQVDILCESFFLAIHQINGVNVADNKLKLIHSESSYCLCKTNKPFKFSVKYFCI